MHNRLDQRVVEASAGRGAPLHDGIPVRGHVLIELYEPTGG